MTGTAPGQAGQGRPRTRPPLSLKHVPPLLDDEPAYRDDPIMHWTHGPEEPPEERALQRAAAPPAHRQATRP